ncbi:MAG: PqqD family protein [Clostridiales bacterium]|nr:PqqD family protein [Clostridiales bacterium]
MKAKEGFVLRKVADNYIIVAAGRASLDFSKVINLNETGAFLWKLLEEGTTLEKMSEALLNEYNVSPKAAQRDIEIFVEKVRQQGMLE